MTFLRLHDKGLRHKALCNISRLFTSSNKGRAFLPVQKTGMEKKN